MGTNDLAWDGDDGGRGLTGVDIGVIGVAATRLVDPLCPPRSSWLAMEDYAALIDDRTPMRALPLPLSKADVGSVAVAITGQRPPLSAALVVGLAASESAEVARRAADAGGPLVIAETDVVSAALAAAAMALLRCREVPRGRARVVMAGAESVPLLGPILIACGIGDLTTWHLGDAQDYPLYRLMQHSDILIDPESATPTLASDRTLTIPPDPFDFGALVVPGLLSGLCGHGVAALDVEHLAAAAHVVGLLAPADRLLPELDEPLLVTTIAGHISLTLTDRHR